MESGQIQHLAPVGHRQAIGGISVASTRLSITVVPAFEIDEPVPCPRQLGRAIEALAVLDGPAGKSAGGFVNVLVDITGGLAFRRTRHLAPARIMVVEIGAAPEGMQLKQLPAETLALSPPARE